MTGEASPNIRFATRISSQPVISLSGALSILLGLTCDIGASEGGWDLAFCR